MYSYLGQNIRELLGVLATGLIEEGFKGEAERLIEYVRRYRREIAELSEETP